MRKTYFLTAVFICLITSVAIAQQAKPKASFKVPYEKFTLPNGLEVIFHVDKSDPVVAVSLTAHVGSAREKVGVPALPICLNTWSSWNRKTWARTGWIK